MDITTERQTEWILDIIAYLSERIGYTTATDDQLLDILGILKTDGIEHSMAAHLMIKPSRKELFERIRIAVERQKDTPVNVRKIATDWAKEIMTAFDKEPIKGKHDAN